MMNPTWVDEQTLIGMQMEVQRTMLTFHLDVTNCFQMYSDLPKETRIILKTPDGFNVLPMHPSHQRSTRIATSNYVKIRPKLIYFAYSFHRPRKITITIGVGMGSVSLRLCTQPTISAFVQSSDCTQQLDDVCSKLQSEFVQINRTWKSCRFSDTLTRSMRRDLESMLVKYGMAGKLEILQMGPMI
jgi:hypothetical protein